MRAVLLSLPFLPLGILAADAEPSFCAVYIDEAELMDIMPPHVPNFSHVIDTGETFEEGGEIYQEYIIVVEPLLLSGRIGLGEGMIMYNGQPLTAQELEDIVMLNNCAIESFALM